MSATEVVPRDDVVIDLSDLGPDLECEMDAKPAVVRATLPCRHAYMLCADCAAELKWMHASLTSPRCSVCHVPCSEIDWRRL